MQRREPRTAVLSVGLVCALACVLAPGGSQAESNRAARLQLEREQAARQLELKLEQLQFARRARASRPTGAPDASPARGTSGARLPIAGIATDAREDAGAASAAEIRRLRSLFDRERFEQRQLQLEQRRRSIALPPPRAGSPGLASTRRDRLRIPLDRFRTEHRQQMLRLRSRR